MLYSNIDCVTGETRDEGGEGEGIKGGRQIHRHGWRCVGTSVETSIRSQRSVFRADDWMTLRGRRYRYYFPANVDFNKTDGGGRVSSSAVVVEKKI